MKPEEERKELSISLAPGGARLTVPEGATVLDALRMRPGPAGIAAPCGGRGTCGKCLIRVHSGRAAAVTDRERALLRDDQIAQGFRLACLTFPEGDLSLSVPGQMAGEIVTEGPVCPVVPDRAVRKIFLELSPPSIDDQADDLERIKREIPSEELEFPACLIPGIPERIRDREFRCTLVLRGRRVIALEPGDTRGSSYAAAVDLGTTTVAVFLLNAETGERLGVLSEMNDQRRYGADVLSRISYVLDYPGGLEAMKECVRHQIRRMVIQLSEIHGIDRERVYSCHIAGNTTMMHLAAGVSPGPISRYPYIPVFTGSLRYGSGEAFWGETGQSPAEVTLLPGVAGYIGSDILCGILSVGMDQQDETCLLLDIGTNGELVLGNKEGFLCCSTAAGPAFEGAHISCGAGGVRGAVKRVWPEEDSLGYSTIGDAKPMGICGSGILDTTAFLLRSGLIDHKGRLLPAEALRSLPENLRQRRRKISGQDAFVLEEGGSGAAPVVFTQKDIREVQLAKAAIAAGIESLVREKDLGFDGVSRVYIAGGFGNYIDPDSAVAIGLLPEELDGKIRSVGNSAGAGAVQCALSAQAEERCDTIRNKTEYMELSARTEFKKRLMKHMYFPEGRSPAGNRGEKEVAAE